MSHVHVEVFALFSNNKPPINVFLMTDGMSESDFKRFGSICKRFGKGYACNYTDCSELPIGEHNTHHRFGRYSYYRLFIPFIQEIDRALYIDTDALVVGDLSELYGLEMGKNLVAGCIDNGVEEYKLGLGFSPDEQYINSGVLLMNLPAIRKNGLHNAWLNMISGLQITDQDTINVTCKDRIHFLNNKWNSSLSTGFNDNPAIVHFAGDKPWDKDNVPLGFIWEYWRCKYNECFP